MRLKIKEIIIFGLLAIGGIAVVFLPNYKKHDKVLPPNYLLYELNKEGRYMDTDELAKALMTKDPSILLIDVRSKVEYEKFSLDGAINIPLDSILNESNLGYLDQDIYQTILFSNGSSLADEAWIIMKSHAYEGNYVLKGGINEWFKTILNPEQPKPTADALAREEYEFRKGASLFFIGVSPNGAGVVSDGKPKVKAAPKPIAKRKKKAVSGGCG